MDKTFALMTADVVVSLATYFITKYISPDAAKDILYVIAGLQPMIIYVIKTWKDKDVAVLNQGVDPKTKRSFR